MPQPDHIHILPIPETGELDADLQKYLSICEEKLGLVPNVLKSYSFRPERLRKFIDHYNEVMLAESKLSKLEREMIAVVVSSCNRCYYCLVAHGQAVRELSGDPELGEMLVMNYRVAPLEAKQRAMLDFAWKMTETPAATTEADRQALLSAGFDEESYFDICETIGFFNYTNRMAHGLDMMPNREYHTKNR
ncbi:peroxidase-related enzyme [Aestuariispira insulae]|uniref:Putative peroxidase-related enzyme n=1 Tax=Aestuariispira insulae TaxID=1461337 RepID=A0A3D9HSV2_9PROT|nr:peroxidase-related enzyme [Aestuariispira insulae]RED52495.1 putative peroxidase-related enzyme [Aestuariispira insulae]